MHKRVKIENEFANSIESEMDKKRKAYNQLPFVIVSVKFWLDNGIVFVEIK